MAPKKSARQHKDTRATTSDYLAHWKNDSNSTTLDQAREKRAKRYRKFVNDFYDVYTDFGLEGWGQSLHFCRYPRGCEPMAQGIARHEHYMALKLGLKPGMTVLDVGCGIGGPAKEIAAFVGCKVIALNINEYQLDLGRKFSKEEGVSEDVVEFVHADFMNIPFPDNTFDAVYAEICRVLKPGARFGVYEWVMTDSFSASIPRHIAIRSGIEKGNGIATLRTAAEARAAMSRSFSVQLTEDLAERKDPWPWWYFCSRDTQFAFTWRDWGRVFRMTALGRVLLDLVIRVMELFGIARKGSARIVRELVAGADCIAEGGEKGLFTPMYFMIGEKRKAR